MAAVTESEEVQLVRYAWMVEPTTNSSSRRDSGANNSSNVQKTVVSRCTNITECECTDCECENSWGEGQWTEFSRVDEAVRQSFGADLEAPGKDLNQGKISSKFQESEF